MMFHLSGYWKTDDLFTIAAVKKHTTTPIFTLAIFTLKNQLDMSNSPPYLQQKLINSKV